MKTFLLSTTEIPMFAVLLIVALIIGAVALALMTLLDRTEDKLRHELYLTQLNEERLLAQLRVARNRIAEYASHDAAVKNGRTKLGLTCALATDEHGRRYNAMPGDV